MKTTFKCFLAYKIKSRYFSGCLKVTNQNKTKVVSKHSSIPIQKQRWCFYTMQLLPPWRLLNTGGKAAQRHCSPLCRGMCWHSPPVLCEQRHCQHWQVWTCLSGLEELDHQCCRISTHPAAPLVLQMDHPFKGGAQPWFTIIPRDCRLGAQEPLHNTHESTLSASKPHITQKNLQGCVLRRS